MTSRITDYHQFELWRYEDDSVDLNCFRADCDVDPYVAYMESLVIARSIGEEIHQEEEVFSVSVFEQGTVSTRWRDGNGKTTSWQHFRWIKERLFNASYGGLIERPAPPRWMMMGLWLLEYGVSKVLTRFRQPPSETMGAAVVENSSADMSNVIVLAEHRR